MRGWKLSGEGGGGLSLTRVGVMLFDPVLNQFLSATPMKPDLIKNDG